MPPYTASTMVAPRHLLTLLPAVILLAACGTPRDAVHIQSVARTAAPTAAARAVGDRVVPPNPVVPVPPAIPALSTTPPASPVPPGVTLGGDSDAALLAAIRAALGADEAHVSVVVRRLRDGRGAALNADREYYAASLFKLALLY